VNDETKGRRAAEILTDAVFIEAEAMTKADLMSAWSAEKEQAKRESLWMELQGLGATRRALQKLVDRATKSAHDRARQESRLNA
jgi:hypothetical protein